MPTITASRTINAPIEFVFNTISTATEFQKAVPHITNIEFLSEQKEGVGTKFRETRMMRGREASSVLELTEYDKNRSVRMVSDAGGSIWDTVFTTSEDEGATVLHMTMEARPHKLMARLITPLIMGTIGKAVEKDMDAIKDFCEGAHR